MLHGDALSNVQPPNVAAQSAAIQFKGYS